MDHVREAIAELSAHPGPLLVRGEPGTGKSLVAGMLGAAVAQVIDCHDAGSQGWEAISYPTASVVMIEEVGDATRELQLSLVDFFRARGPAVRLIATTSRDIERFSRTGNFLPELFELLSGPAIWLPPLRTRRSDVPELAAHFLGSLPGRELDWDALCLLERQSWPGNVRQLREAIRRLALLHDRITLDHVECELRTMRVEASRPPQPLHPSEGDVDGPRIPHQSVSARSSPSS